MRPASILVLLAVLVALVSQAQGDGKQGRGTACTHRHHCFHCHYHPKQHNHECHCDCDHKCNKRSPGYTCPKKYGGRKCYCCLPGDKSKRCRNYNKHDHGHHRG